jgi:hypothetical protein
VRVETRLDAAMSMLAAFGGAVVLTCLLAATGGTHRLGPDLAAFAVLAALTAVTSRWWAVFAIAGIDWLFYAGFLVGRHGEIAWHGTIDGWRIAMILAAGCGGALVDSVLRAATEPRTRRSGMYANAPTAER